MLTGVFVSAPFAIITTAISVDLVSFAFCDLLHNAFVVYYSEKGHHTTLVAMCTQQVHVQAYTLTHPHTYVHTCTYPHNTCIHLAHALTHTHTHTHTHTRTHTHTHTHTPHMFKIIDRLIALLTVCHSILMYTTHPMCYV